VTLARELEVDWPASFARSKAKHYTEILMARKKKPNLKKETNNGANLGFESQLWAAADKLRGHMDASPGGWP